MDADADGYGGGEQRSGDEVLDSASSSCSPGSSVPRFRRSRRRSRAGFLCDGRPRARGAAFRGVRPAITSATPTTAVTRATRPATLLEVTEPPTCRGPVSRHGDVPTSSANGHGDSLEMSAWRCRARREPRPSLVRWSSERNRRPSVRDGLRDVARLRRTGDPAVSRAPSYRRTPHRRAHCSAFGAVLPHLGARCTGGHWSQPSRTPERREEDARHLERASRTSCEICFGGRLTCGVEPGS